VNNVFFNTPDRISPAMKMKILLTGTFMMQEITRVLSCLYILNHTINKTLQDGRSFLVLTGIQLRP
jgi:hypothetical protein